MKEIIQPKAKQLKAKYYFKEWYHCTCGYWGREEKNKVYNETKAEPEEVIIALNGKRYKIVELPS